MQGVELEAYSGSRQVVMGACTVVVSGKMERWWWSYETKIGEECQNNWVWGLCSHGMHALYGEGDDITEGMGLSSKIVSPGLNKLN